MTEKDLYERTVMIWKAADELIGAALEMPATIELCTFTGKLSSVCDILATIAGAGPPVHGPNEEPHPLG